MYDIKFLESKEKENRRKNIKYRQARRLTYNAATDLLLYFLNKNSESSEALLNIAEKQNKRKVVE